MARSATTEYLRHAREASSFYNAFFLDHDDGAVYFNVLANGMPFLLGNERFKGSHSMSAYHTTELCYLSAVYTNLLITKEPMDFYFKPLPEEPQAQHPARLAGHPAPRQHQDRAVLDRRCRVHQLRRRRPDGQTAGQRHAGARQGPHRAGRVRPLHGGAAARRAPTEHHDDRT